MPRSPSAVERARAAIKQQILDGEWAVGSYLPREDDLVTACGVGRAAVREAVKQLEALGWLQIDRGNGTRVRKPDFTSIAHTVEYLNRRDQLRYEHVLALRRLIEIEVVGELARHCPHRVVQDLYAHNQRILDHRDRPEGYIEADVDFHDCLLRNAANPLYPLLMDGFRDYLVLSRSLSYQGRASVEQSARDHIAIIKAIEAQDEDAARRLMTEHLRTVSRRTGENQRQAARPRR